MSKMAVFAMTLLFSFCLFAESFSQKIKVETKVETKIEIKESSKKIREIIVEYKNKPFYFRFPPKLKDIKGKHVIMAKIDYEHPFFGLCSYEIVKDLERSKFFGWCNTKKIKRRETKIFELDGEKFKKLAESSNKVEMGLNENLKVIITKINDKHRQVLKK